jgi:tRNA threonylcarbamoyladenosine biosynthesis protein TsaB
MSGSGPWLLLDSAAPEACVALVRDDRVLAERSLEVAREHAERLPGAIEEVLEEAGLHKQDLAGIGVGRGPGSFVGVRVGISQAKGLATALRLPLIGLCSLTALGGSAAAEAEADADDGDALLVALDARRGELYVRRLRATDGAPLDGPRTASPEEARELAAGAWLAVTNRADLLGEGAISRAGPTGAGLSFALAARRAAGEHDDERISLVPEYCRAPDAKLPGGRSL